MERKQSGNITPFATFRDINPKQSVMGHSIYFSLIHRRTESLLEKEK